MNDQFGQPLVTSAPSHRPVREEEPPRFLEAAQARYDQHKTEPEPRFLEAAQARYDQQKRERGSLSLGAARQVLSRIREQHGTQIPPEKSAIFESARTIWLREAPAGDPLLPYVVEVQELPKQPTKRRISPTQRFGKDILSEDIQPESLEEAIVLARTDRAGPAKQGAERYLLHRVPFFGGTFKTTEWLALMEAAERIANGKAKSQDYLEVGGYLAEGEEEGEKSWKRKVADLTTAIPGFTVEFMATGGVFTAGRKLAEKGAQKAVGKLVKRRVGRAVTAAVGASVGAAAQTAANPQLIAENTSRRLAQQWKLGQDELGQLQVILNSDPEGFIEALGKGALDSAIEITSERTGYVLTKLPGLSRVTSLQSALVNRWLGSGRTVQALQEMLDKARWHGVAGELFEERVGELARGATGLEEYPEYTSKEFLEQLSIEAAAFAVFGGAPRVAATAADRLLPATDATQMAAAGLAQVEDSIQKIGAPTVEQGKALGMPPEAMKNRKTRRKWWDQNQDRLKKETQGASAVRGIETEVPEDEGRTHFRGPREEQVPTEPTGEVAEALPEVSVEAPTPQEAPQQPKAPEPTEAVPTQPPAAQEPEAAPEAPRDYSGMSAKDLRAEAKRRGLKRYGGKNKAAVQGMLEKVNRQEAATREVRQVRLPDGRTIEVRGRGAAMYWRDPTATIGPGAGGAFLIASPEFRQQIEQAESARPAPTGKAQVEAPPSVEEITAERAEQARRAAAEHDAALKKEQEERAERRFREDQERLKLARPVIEALETVEPAKGGKRDESGLATNRSPLVFEEVVGGKFTTAQLTEARLRLMSAGAPAAAISAVESATPVSPAAPEAQAEAPRFPDITSRRLGEVRARPGSERNYLTQYSKKKPGSLLNKTEQSVMDAVGEGLGIGYISNALTYAKELDQFSKSQRKALLSLLDRGELKIEDRGNAEWIVPSQPPSRPEGAETAKTKLQQAAEKARQEASDELDAFGKTLKGKGLAANPMLDPELVAAAAKLTAKFVKAGTLEFAAFLEQVSKAIGRAAAERIRPALEAEWEKLRQTGELPGMETLEPAAPGVTTGTKNIKTEQLRQRARLGERVREEPETREEWDAEAEQQMAADPGLAGRLAGRLAESPRAISELEESILGRHIRNLENHRQAGEDVTDEILTAVEASERAGNIWGKAGVARQAEREADFSLAGIVRQHFKSVNEQPTDAEAAKYEEMANRIAALETERDALQKKLAQAEVDKEIAAVKRQKQPAPRPKKGTKRQQLQRQASDAVSAFKEEWATLFQTGVVYDPKQQAEKWTRITKAAAKVVKAYMELGVDSVTELLGHVRRDMGPLTADQKRAFDEAWKGQRGAVESPLGEEPDAAGIGTLARKLTRWAVESGVTEREEVVDVVHRELQEVGLEISRSETMRAMSGYGEFTELAKDEISVKVRGIRGELQQLLKLEDMQAGEAPRKTGVERRTPTAEERRLIKLVEEAKKRGGYVVTDPARQLRSALATAKTALRNRIADLEQEIATREKIVKERTPLKPDAELVALREQRDRLLEEHRRIFPPKKTGISDAQRLKMAEGALDRQIAEMEADLKAGRLGPKQKRAPLTSPALEAKQGRLADLKEARDRAREGSPQYQAEETARQTARYKKSLQRQLAFWGQRRDEAAQGKLPKKRKPTPEDDAILEKKWEIEKVKREAQAEIEKAERASRGRIGKALGFGGDLLDLSRAIMTGYELSAVLRQGAFYTLGFPRQALPSVWRSVQAALSRQADFALHDDLQQRPNHADYARGGVEMTVSDGPLSHREELIRSRIASWLAQTEGWGWAVPRWAAEGLLGSERAFRTFLNTMRADVFDYMKASVEASRPGTWSEEDAKVLGNAANVVSGRSPIRSAVGLSRIFFAPRWVWSRVQLGAFQPLWKGDAATRRAVGKVYVRGTVGMAAFFVLRHFIHTLLAGDDEEYKPKYELDPRSSDFGKMRVGETRLDTGVGMNQLVTLAARLTTGETKRQSGEIVPVRGEDVPYGGSDSREILFRFLNTKLAPLPSAVMDFMTGETVVGEKATVGKIVGERTSPMTWRDIWEAEHELNVPQGSVAAIEAFFGTSMMTYGARKKYREASAEEREEQFERDLENMEWNTPLLAYSDMLTPEQLKQAEERKAEKKEAVIYAAFHEPDRKTHKSDKTFQRSIEKRDNALATFREMELSHAEAQELLVESFWQPDNKGKMGSEKEGGKRKKAYSDRGKALAQFYGLEEENFSKWRVGFRKGRAKKRAEWAP